MNKYQLKAFFLCSLVFFMLGIAITIIFTPIDVVFGFSLGFIITMAIVMIMIHRIMSEKHTDKSLSSEDGIG